MLGGPGGGDSRGAQANKGGFAAKVAAKRGRRARATAKKGGAKSESRGQERG